MIYRIPKQPELLESNRLLELILAKSDGLNYKPSNAKIAPLDRGKILYLSDKDNQHAWNLQNAYIAHDATLVHDDDNYVILPLSINNVWDTSVYRERYVTVACLNDEADSAESFEEIFSKTTIDGKSVGDLIASLWVNPLSYPSTGGMLVHTIDLYAMYNAGAIPDDYTHVWRAKCESAHLLKLSNAISVDYDTLVSTGIGKASTQTFVWQIQRSLPSTGTIWNTPGVFNNNNDYIGLANLIDYAIPGTFTQGDTFDTLTFDNNYIWISTEEAVAFQVGYFALISLVSKQNESSTASDRLYLRS